MLRRDGVASLSNIIETFIKGLLDKTDGIAEIQRNELANKFNCVPSQINYVIATRFTADQGYYVESYRGGGGYVRIKRINVSADQYLAHIALAMGDSLSQQSAEAFINNFLDYDAVSYRESMLLKAAVSDRVMRGMPQPLRDKLRARILKNMITSLLE